MQITGRLRWAEKFSGKADGDSKPNGSDFNGKPAPSVSA
jgi:hypothetical protein